MRFYPTVSNGKEKDHESGFHYYGARYYWSELWRAGIQLKFFHDEVQQYANQ